MRPTILLLPFLLALAGCASSSPGSSGGPPPPSYPFSSAATMEFVTQFGTGTFVASTNEGDTISGIAQDNVGNIYIAGYTAGNLSGSTGTVGILKGTLYKLDSKGNQIWARELTTGSGDTLCGVALTSNGVLVAGATMGAYPGMSNASGKSEPFIALFDTAGNRQWVKQYASAYAVQVDAMRTDSNGDVLLGGEIGDDRSGQDVWLEKFDASGVQLWQKTYGSGAIDVTLGISSDAAGDFYAAGVSDGTFPGGPSNATGMPFVLKLDGTSGTTVWLQQFASDSALSSMYASAVSSTSDGHLYVLGEVGTFPTSAAIELVQVDPGTGAANWKFQFGSGGRNIPGSSIAVDPAGNIYVPGITQGALTSSATAGTQDVFLAKISPTGAPVWAQQLGTGKDEPPLESTGSTPVYVCAGSNDVVLGGVTAGQFAGFSNPNQAIELFVARFGQ